MQKGVLPIFTTYKRRRAIEQQKAQLEKIVEEESASLYRIAFSYTHQKEDALDVVQDSFQKALVQINKAKPIDDFHAWFYRILINTATDQWRKKKRSAAELQLPENREWMAHLPEISQVELQSILELIESPEKEILILKFFEGFRLKEIAEILELNENTVKTKMYRSLNQLRKILEK